jgi:hypothetical protein
MSKYFLLSMMLVSSSVQAADFCARSNVEFTQLLEAPESRIAFRNDGGLIDGGVCWWHSRLQRSSVYLAQYAPEKSKPTQNEARLLVQDLIHFRRVVEIPGYANFSSFSQDYENVIQKELEQWQLRDGFIYQQWARGVYGRAQMPAKTLKKRMNKVYEKFSRSKPGMWAMIQMKGITSHALLFIGMTKNAQGYHIRAIDSNRPELTREFDYRYGDRSLYLNGNAFVPYVGFQLDQVRINSALARHCQ